MPRSYLDPPRPICALATVPGPSALALVRASGPGSVEALAKAFSRPDLLLRPLEGGRPRLVHGWVLDPALPGSEARIDEVMAAVYRAPASSTGEDAFELSCHGSPAVVARLLALLESLGLAPALPGEFTFRAVANGKLDLVRAEAVAELAGARTEAARAAALGRLEGSLSRRLAAARADLLARLAEVELRLDYGDDEVPEDLDLGALAATRDSLDTLARSFAGGRLLAQGLGVVLAGAPNAGKSRLFNLLLREERAIVSPEPGTTRDYLEAEVEVGGYRLRLLDTAGLREAAGAVEAAGVARSEALVAEADLVLLVVDGPAWDGPGIPALPSRPDALVVWNKVDLAARPAPPGALAVSALTGEGLPDLVAELGRRAAALTRGPGSGPSIASGRQHLLLERTVGALDRALACAASGLGLDALALDLREAAESLGELTGEVTTPEVLETLFSTFCVGK